MTELITAFDEARTVRVGVCFQRFSGSVSGPRRSPTRIIASMRRLTLVMAAAALSAIAHVEPNDWREVRADVQRKTEVAAELRARGFALGYNLDYPEALAAFNDAIAADPDHPAGYRLAAATVWITLLFDQGAITVEDYLGQARADVARLAADPARASLVREQLRRAVALAEQQARAHPTDADAHYQLGAAFGVQASFASTVEGRVLGSLKAARRAYQEHERALALDPRRKDAGLIVGLYRYGISALPLPLRAMAHLIGFEAGREPGLTLVEQAAGYSSDAQPNALFALVLLYNREGRYDEALRVIAELQRLFPRNRLLWLEAGTTALRAGRPAVARRWIEEGLERSSSDPRPHARGEESRWRYAYGATLIALHDASAAERELHAALGLATRDWVRGRVHKELGRVADLRGDRPSALAEYELADRFCGQDDDSDCEHEVKRLMKGTR
jgi:tetratricopeptide (TPR) repeat protein